MFIVVVVIINTFNNALLLSWNLFKCLVVWVLAQTVFETRMERKDRRLFLSVLNPESRTDGQSCGETLLLLMSESRHWRTELRGNSASADVRGEFKGTSIRVQKLSQSKTVWSVNTQTLREHIYSIWTQKTRGTTRKMSGKHSSRSKSSLQNLSKIKLRHMIHLQLHCRWKTMCCKNTIIQII